MKFNVTILKHAKEDINDIFDYVLMSDKIENAEKIIKNIEKVIRSLSNLPNRGHNPPELERIGITDFKEIHDYPYRIIYRIIDNNVFIHGVFDSRRNLSELLEKRLLR